MPVFKDKRWIWLLYTDFWKGWSILYRFPDPVLLWPTDRIKEYESHIYHPLPDTRLFLLSHSSYATLIFTTHYCELLDLFNRQDNIYIAKSNDKVYLTNMYDGFNIRSELLKSRQFYNNVFQTAVNYDELMQLKKELKVWKNFWSCAKVQTKKKS